MSPEGEIRNPKAEGRSPNYCPTTVSPVSDFGFRISDLFLIFCLSANSLLAAAPDGTSDLPASSLKPPRGEIQPSSWEQHGPLVVVGAIILLALLALAILLLLRPKPPRPPIPAAEQARNQLEPLRHQPENGARLSRTSQILHGYLASGLGIAGELTTAELCQAVAQNREMGPDFAREIGEFLRDCDVRKFAPNPPATPVGAVAGALRIIEQCESRQAELKAAATAVSAPNANPSPQTAKPEPTAKGA
jgi:hypothetical protein